MVAFTTFGASGWALFHRSPQDSNFAVISGALDPPAATDDSVPTPTPTPTDAPTQHNSSTKTGRTPLSTPAKSSTTASGSATIKPPVGDSSTSSTTPTSPSFPASKSTTPPEGGPNLTLGQSHTSSGSRTTASDQVVGQSLSLNGTSSSALGNSAVQSVVPTANSIPSGPTNTNPTPSLTSMPQGRHHIGTGIIAVIVVIAFLLLLAISLWMWKRNASRKRILKAMSQNSTDPSPFSTRNASHAGRFILAQYTTTEKTEKYRNKFTYAEESRGEGESSSYPRDIDAGAVGDTEVPAQEIPPRIQYRVHEDAGRVARSDIGNEEEVIIDLPPDYSTLAETHSQLQLHISRIARAG